MYSKLPLFSYNANKERIFSMYKMHSSNLKRERKNKGKSLLIDEMVHIVFVYLFGKSALHISIDRA